MYLQKGIPTINIVTTGKSGPLEKYINEELYVSEVGVKQIQLVEDKIVSDEIKTPTREYKYSTDNKITETIGKKV